MGRAGVLKDQRHQVDEGRHMRTFIALELPETFADDVAALSRCLRRSVDGRFMKRETYHLTLAFLGDIDESEAARAIDALERACAGCPPVPLSCTGLGKFGKPHDCTLWLGVEPVTELMGLAQAVRTELTSAGVTYDTKPFRPHITLARRARMPRGDLGDLVFPAPGWASRVVLFKSMLTQEGANYKPLYVVELQN